MMLKVDQLTVRFGRRTTPAISGIGFHIDQGERLGLIGESGSGKSVTSLAVMGLLGDTARISGSIRWKGEELVGRSDAHYSRLRGAAMGMVFQEPMTALDPTMRCGRQVAEVVRLHAGAVGRRGPRSWKSSSWWGWLIPNGSPIPTPMNSPAGNVSVCSSPWRWSTPHNC